MNLQETLTAKVQYIFDAIEKSGLSVIDFHRLTSISRTSLYRWKQGCKISDRLRLDLAHGTAMRIERACRAGRLPLVDKYKEKERIAVLRRIISESK